MKNYKKEDLLDIIEHISNITFQEISDIANKKYKEDNCRAAILVISEILYEISKELFPSNKDFIEGIHKQNLEILEEVRNSKEKEKIREEIKQGIIKASEDTGFIFHLDENSIEITKE